MFSSSSDPNPANTKHIPYWLKSEAGVWAVISFCILNEEISRDNLNNIRTNCFLILNSVSVLSSVHSQFVHFRQSCRSTFLSKVRQCQQRPDQNRIIFIPSNGSDCKHLSPVNSKNFLNVCKHYSHSVKLERGKIVRMKMWMASSFNYYQRRWWGGIDNFNILHC